MKVTGLLLVSVLALAGVANHVEAQGTMTKVVKLLQGLMEKSKEDGKEEATLYAKFKCYCDAQEEEKTTTIDSLTERISVLESQIEELQASTGKLSMEVAQLRTDVTWTRTRPRGSRRRRIRNCRKLSGSVRRSRWRLTAGRRSS